MPKKTSQASSPEKKSGARHQAEPVTLGSVSWAMIPAVEKVDAFAYKADLAVRHGAFAARAARSFAFPFAAISNIIMAL